LLCVFVPWLLKNKSGSLPPSTFGLGSSWAIRALPRSKLAFRLEFRVYAAKGGEGPEPPEGGTPNGGSARMRHSSFFTAFSS